MLLGILKNITVVEIDSQPNFINDKSILNTPLQLNSNLKNTNLKVISNKRLAFESFVVITLKYVLILTTKLYLSKMFYIKKTIF